MDTIKPFFPKIRVLLMLKKGQVRPTSIISPLVARLSVKEQKVKDKNVEVNLVPESCISGLQQKNPLGDKWLKLLSDGENKADPIH